MSEWILAVSDLNEYVRRTLAADPMLRSLRLRGEISNFKRHTSGHWYFTLKDEHSRINCVMFRQNAMRMSLRPMDGMQVILSGSVSLYAEGGQYQFYAENMRPDGLGTLYQQFEALKSKLAAEGLFDAGRKRPLPLRPRKIAVVTSRTGAVLQDIRNVSARRDAGVPLVLLPVQVQGEGAAESIAAAIRKAGTLPGVDVIITGRGGGSMEDLWVFNEEIVARAIWRCQTPVISAVGHEPDVTIADYVADVRAATPSNGAELAVRDSAALQSALRQLQVRMEQAQIQSINRLRQRLDTLSKSRVMRQPDAYLQQQELHLEMLRQRLEHSGEVLLAKNRQRFERTAAKLDALSPLKVLGRGYAMVTREKTVIRETAQLTPGDTITVSLSDGTAQCTVDTVQRRNKRGKKADI